MQYYVLLCTLPSLRRSRGTLSTTTEVYEQYICSNRSDENQEILCGNTPTFLVSITYEEDAFSATVLLCAHASDDHGAKLGPSLSLSILDFGGQGVSWGRSSVGSRIRLRIRAVEKRTVSCALARVSDDVYDRDYSGRSSVGSRIRLRIRAVEKRTVSCALARFSGDVYDRDYSGRSSVG
jgi:hypothetical protein